MGYISVQNELTLYKVLREYQYNLFIEQKHTYTDEYNHISDICVEIVRALNKKYKKVEALYDDGLVRYEFELGCFFYSSNDKYKMSASANVGTVNYHSIHGDDLYYIKIL